MAAGAPGPAAPRRLPSNGAALTDDGDVDAAVLARVNGLKSEISRAAYDQSRRGIFRRDHLVLGVHLVVALRRSRGDEPCATAVDSARDPAGEDASGEGAGGGGCRNDTAASRNPRDGAEGAGAVSEQETVQCATVQPEEGSPRVRCEVARPSARVSLSA